MQTDFFDLTTLTPDHWLHAYTNAPADLANHTISAIINLSQECPQRIIYVVALIPHWNTARKSWSSLDLCPISPACLSEMTLYSTLRHYLCLLCINPRSSLVAFIHQIAYFENSLTKAWYSSFITTMWLWAFIWDIILGIIMTSYSSRVDNSGKSK